MDEILARHESSLNHVLATVQNMLTELLAFRVSRTQYADHQEIKRFALKETSTALNGHCPTVTHTQLQQKISPLSQTTTVVVPLMVNANNMAGMPRLPSTRQTATIPLTPSFTYNWISNQEAKMQQQKGIYYYYNERLLRWDCHWCWGGEEDGLQGLLEACRPWLGPSCGHVTFILDMRGAKEMSCGLGFDQVVGL
ncbi:hypothetical protein FNV43_RR24522 [Rhamnella rubrinervis]|uniref:Uncharacterized protein n=1 Tax=Rhamnella rubrinervis TaxID=2594499 RepID=A0A8K0GT89_9ROSA|nr:hypothetical protein FNV43_RR24522 [Rhamnella rubrinervis]